MKENDNKNFPLALLVLLLFLAGTALIGWGLLRISVTAALIHGGIVLLYLSWCVSRTIYSNGKDH